MSELSLPRFFLTSDPGSFAAIAGNGLMVTSTAPYGVLPCRGRGRTVTFVSYGDAEAEVEAIGLNRFDLFTIAHGLLKAKTPVYQPVSIWLEQLIQFERNLCDLYGPPQMPRLLSLTDSTRRRRDWNEDFFGALYAARGAWEDLFKGMDVLKRSECSRDVSGIVRQLLKAIDAALTPHGDRQLLESGQKMWEREEKLSRQSLVPHPSSARVMVRVSSKSLASQLFLNWERDKEDGFKSLAEAVVLLQNRRPDRCDGEDRTHIGVALRQQCECLNHGSLAQKLWPEHTIGAGGKSIFSPAGQNLSELLRVAEIVERELADRETRHAALRHTAQT